MITRLIGAATLFSAGAILLTGTPDFAATPVAFHGAGAAVGLAGGCGGQDTKKDDAAKDTKAAPAKAKKEGSCGKDGSCGKSKKGGKDGSCGKDKKDGSCGKDKKTAKAPKAPPADAPKP